MASANSSLDDQEHLYDQEEDEEVFENEETGDSELEEMDENVPPKED